MELKEALLDLIMLECLAINHPAFKLTEILFAPLFHILSIFCVGILQTAVFHLGSTLFHV